jgi:hypothetical protein
VTAAADALTPYPLFAGMEDGPARQRLIAALRPSQHPAGSVLVEENADAAELILLVRGEVEVRRQGRLLTVLEAPGLVGLLAILDAGTRSATVQAVADVDVLALSRVELELAFASSAVLRQNLVRYLAGTVRELYDREFDMLLSFDDIFESPNAQLLPGPYEFEPFPAMFFVLACDAEKHARLLPPGLSLVPGMRDRMLVVCSFIERCTSTAPGSSGRWFSYQETTPFIPCVADGGRPGLYTPELYPDAYLPIILGREVYGFPKRFGRTVKRNNGVDLWLGDRSVMRARWNVRREVGSSAFGSHLLTALSPCGPFASLLGPLAGAAFTAMNGATLGAAAPSPVVFVRRQLLSERSREKRILRIDELVEVPIRLDRFSEFAILDNAAITFPDPSFFLSGTCLAAASARMGFQLGGGRVRRSYMPTAAHAGGESPAATMLGWLKDALR